eukprot:1154540-Pelagomonas_calceolata.AAC.3
MLVSAECCSLAVMTQPSNQLDQHLEALAHQHQGTLFMRTLVGHKSPLRAQLSLPSVPVFSSIFPVCVHLSALVDHPPENLEMVLTDSH